MIFSKSIFSYLLPVVIQYNNSMNYFLLFLIAAASAQPFRGTECPGKKVYFVDSCVRNCPDSYVNENGICT